MALVLEKLRDAHRFLAQHSFYQLVLASLLANTQLALRIHLTGTWVFSFLIWNLFLAWMPYLWSLWASTIQRRYPGSWWRLLVPGMLWLVFFPNAPYLVTDLVHLRFVAPETLWFDLALLATCAWIGCFLAVASLRIMQHMVEAYAGRPAGWLFVLTSAGLSGLGVYLGRFQRWNTWDLLLNPRAVLADALSRLSQPYDMGVIALFAALLLLCYVTFTPLATRLSPAYTR